MFMVEVIMMSKGILVDDIDLRKIKYLLFHI